MGTYSDIRSRFEAIQTSLKNNGYQRYGNYDVFSPPSGFALNSPMKADDMNAMIRALQQNERGLTYSTYPISEVVRGSYIRKELLSQLDQYKADADQLRACNNCSNTCVTTCYNGCHNCTGSCTGTCTGCSGCNGCSGCSGNCYSCSGGLWCVKCHGCSGCGGCGGCGGCNSACQNDCKGCTSCSTNCNSSCNVNCSTNCKSSCTSGCSYTARLGG